MLRGPRTQGIASIWATRRSEPLSIAQSSTGFVCTDIGLTAATSGLSGRFGSGLDTGQAGRG